MRILVEATAVNQGGGGICTFFLGLLQGWNDAGFDDEWRVVGTPKLPAEVEGLVSTNGRVRRHGWVTPAGRVLLQQALLPAVAHSRAWRPDVVLAMTPVIPVVPSPAPTVAVVYDLRYLRFPAEFGRVNRAYRRIAYRRGIRRADGLLAISEFTCREIDWLGRGGRSAPQLVYPGADHVDSWPAPLGDANHAITFAHWSNKRPDVAVRAWALLQREVPGFSCVLQVVGTRPYETEALHSLASDLGVAGLTRFHPFMAETEFRTLFASSSLVLLPSTMEGFGLPVAEAQRLGIPVVASAVGAIPEVGGDAALYAAEGTPESFAQLSRTALFDRPARASLVENGRRRSKRFTWQRAAERARDELIRVVDSR